LGEAIQSKDAADILANVHDEPRRFLVSVLREVATEDELRSLLEAADKKHDASVHRVVERALVGYPRPNAR